MTDREMAASASIHKLPMKFHQHVVHPLRHKKLGTMRGWPIDDTGAIMAAACMEAVIKKIPINWGHIIGNGQFKKLTIKCLVCSRV